MYAKNQEGNLGIPFDSKYTKRRKEFSVLHLNQTIQTRKIEKKNILFMGKTRKKISELHLTQTIEKPEKNSLCCI